MTSKISCSWILAVGCTVALLILTKSGWAAGEEHVIYNFPSTGSGSAVQLVFASGNVYGTAPSGGSAACFKGCGLVFELTPASGGGWNYLTLYSFNGAVDVSGPIGKMVFDSSGNLYGVAGAGGAWDLRAYPECRRLLERNHHPTPSTHLIAWMDNTHWVVSPATQKADSTAPRTLVASTDPAPYTRCI
jgi:hypothetical protein